MPIPIKSPREIEAMRAAGAALWSVLGRAIDAALPGITTRELDAVVERGIFEAGAEPILKGWRSPDGRAFPNASSICVNEEATHGVPGDRIVRAGDIVSIDAALKLRGWCADAARSVVVGDQDPRGHRRLVSAAADVMATAVSAAVAGVRWSAVALVVERTAAGRGCRVVSEYAGHGIGVELHEFPAVPYGQSRVRGGQQTPACQDFVLRPGMVLTIEPVLTLGRAEMLGLEDGWTVVTRDREPACREERTIAITRRGCVVLTGP